MKQFEFTTSGKIVYDPYRAGMKRRTENWCVITLDREITRYYRYQIQKRFHIHLHEPAWNAHCSVVRGERILQENMRYWKKLHNKRIELQYASYPLQVKDKPHFWIVEAYAPEIDEIRDSLGLTTKFRYHITVGRTYLEENCFVGNSGL